ncbi:DsbE family thiol:disulfide interchange protein [Thiococcus pfennigii]|jgi:cytochrome c biogenesis protein CcmG/thiol:disulfide interchange protein DsbE|uniref:DsbE family thiol:disulfide interchange protein n=1 Tax=Thiococcus pfennigii TaxID=1057 RepID=UPI0019034394|nr:DsbE family thiol:disulfide interchange protein [Thiococcus pfennigii]MBK1701787.1 DsbE family thiol:disulfide interchange protein [Thiococcus pfennigii]MBK1731160.1 DsbE family thiol:disulfide interchange protein [Thiococcus pfennigii]
MSQSRAKKTLKFLIPLGLFVVLVGFLGYGLTTDPRKVPSPLIGKSIPDFTLPTLADPDRQVTQEALKGTVSLVNVWASWCPSCRAEHRMLMGIAQEGIDDLQIVGLNWKDERPQAQDMLRLFGNPYVVNLFDPDNQVGLDFGVYGAPETFVIDRHGIIRYKHIGPVDAEVWEQTLRPLVQQLKAQS